MAIRDHFRFSGLRKVSTVSDAASDSTGHESNSSAKSFKSMNPLKLVKSLSLIKARTNSSSNSSTADGNIGGGISNNNSNDNIVIKSLGKGKKNEEPVINTLDRPEKGVPSWLKKKNKKSNNKKDPKQTHPSEKPLTLVNIQHQEMLNQFTWTFGNRRGSLDGGSTVSPGTSRLPSFDHGSRPMPLAASSSPLAGDGGGTDDGGRQGDYLMPCGRREAHFQSSLLNPESAAFGRRPAMQMVD